MQINIKIDDKANKEIGNLLKNEKDGSCFRISVEGGGCSGFKYNFTIDTKVLEDDLRLDNLVVDKTSLGYLNGSILEYNDNLIEKSFKIKNPKAKSSCGCGTSFSV